MVTSVTNRSEEKTDLFSARPEELEVGKSEISCHSLMLSSRDNSLTTCVFSEHASENICVPHVCPVL